MTETIKGNRLLSSFQKSTNKFLLLLLSADILFIFFHGLGLIVRRYFPSIFILNTFTEDVFSISRDLGLAESFQYVKEFWIVLLLIYIFYKKRELIFIFYSLIFTYIFADDMLRIHETLGTVINDYFTYPQMLGLNGQALGELTLYAIVGVVFSILLIFVYYRSSNEVRIIGRNLFLLLIIFGLFGGAFDMVHSMFRSYMHFTRIWVILERVVSIIEDGGEMIVMSFICWYVFTISSRVDNENILSK